MATTGSDSVTMPSLCDNKPAAKKRKVASTVDIQFPSLPSFVDVWNEGALLRESALQVENSLFGTKRSWFIRKSYIQLWRDIIEDTTRKIHIVHGTAGIGKSSFLLYVLVRMRTLGSKNVLLHFHRMDQESAVAVFFPVDDQPIQIVQSHPNYWETFTKWYEQINEEKSVFLVDGMASFNGVPEYTNVKYIVAKSPSCPIGWMKKDPNKIDRWLPIWDEAELLSYASQTEIEESVVKENMRYLGGIVRNAFLPGRAEYAANDAINEAGALELFKLVESGLHSKFDDLRIVDRLIHRLPPESGIGSSARFRFASEYVATKVSMALAISTIVETKSLLRLFKLSPAASMRGLLFESYAARQIAAGGKFVVKPLCTVSATDTNTECQLLLDETTILQKDTKTLNLITYPLSDIQNKLVWPNPAYNLPSIDMFMLRPKTLIAFQMTVSKSHTLEIGGCKAFLRYFDSVCRELYEASPEGTIYDLFFVVPEDIYNKFSNSAQLITGGRGKVPASKEANDISARISQWVMKVE